MLAIELDLPHALGPIEVAELSVSLPNVRFPVDLSGGVARFRHRRGALDHLVLRAKPEGLARWAAPRLRGLLGEAAPEVSLVPIDSGLLVGLGWERAALAFDLLLAPMDGDLRLVPERARGIGLGAPPHALALRALGAALSPFAKVTGGAIVLAGAAAQVGRHLFPIAGARAPSASGVRFQAPSVEAVLSIEASAGSPPAALSERVLRALELVELGGAADDAAAAGELDEARRLYLALLERAPRHPEASQRLAWIDLVAGDRADAALSTLVDAIPVAFAGVLGGELLEAIGDHEGARAALGRGAEAEPFGPLAALMWLASARMEGPLNARFEALSQAVARAPSLAEARWARLEARLDLGDARGARADAEHLEAAAKGPEARHAVYRRAAEAFLARGFVAESTTLFERALRYAPDSAAAVTGLGRALRAAGQDLRALDLFARAVALADRGGLPAHAAELELARGLAEAASDRPAAVARVRAIPAGVAESFEARLLEGRWRTELGDLAGAALAFGRLRDAVELSPPRDGDVAARVAAFLVEAAEAEEREREDLAAAKRSLGLALRLRPRDRAIAASFRRVAKLAEAPPAPPAAPAPISEPAAIVVPRAPRAPAPRIPEPISFVPDSEPPVSEAPATTASPSASPLLGPPSSASAAERRVDELTAKVRADPSNHAIAMALADALEKLGRDLDLLALLSARMEEGDDDDRRDAAPRRRAVLLRLAADARANGRASEASLYEAMASADDD